MLRKPLIGITLGDPSGIGPEVVLRALADGGCGRRRGSGLLGSRAS